MIRSWLSLGWHLRLFGLLVIVGALAELSVGIEGVKNRAFAQIKPDDTLGDERSVVTSNVIRGKPSDRIEGGAKRGANLFHSFRDFNVGEGRGAYFTDPDGIENIFSRVTGDHRSDILGTLGVLGKANLFLINPNGILFGPNASLDIEGSFVGTTANAIGFGDRGFFSATNPNIPSQLLTVNPSAFFFNQLPTGAIENKSVAPAGTNSTVGIVRGLRVPDGRSLILLGGNVTLNSSGVNALGGRVELGGVAGVGKVGLTTNSNNLQLNFSEEVTRADVLITNGSRVDAIAGEGGDIAINARNVDISRGSAVFAGIGQGLGSFDSKAGDIKIHATGKVELFDTSLIGNAVTGIGSGGSISITGQTVDITNGSAIAAASFGGDAGNVTIQAADTISLSGKNANGVVSAILSSVVSLQEFGLLSNGNGGNVDLQARQITLADGAQIGTTTLFAQGNAGNIQIDVSDSLLMLDSSALQAITVGQGNAGNIAIQAGNRVALANDVQLTTETSGQGDAGNITIQTGKTVSLSNGAGLRTQTSGQGNAGSVNLRAGDRVLFEGVSPSGNRSGIFSSVNPVSGFAESRRAGEINIDTGSLSIADGAGIYSNVEAGAVGEGGDINVTADSISLLNGGQIQSILRGASNELPGGRGRTGNVRINIRDTFTAMGRDNDGFPSGAFTTVGAGAEGTGGNLSVVTSSLSLDNGGRLETGTDGVGNSGNVSVKAREDISIEAGSGFTSGIFTDVNSDAIGNGGSIAIQARSLTLTSLADAASSRVDISTGTSGKGDAGNISIQIDDSVSLSQQSYIFSDISGGGQGDAGDIYIKARSLTLSNGGELAASVFREENGVPGGRGEGGNIQVDASGSVNISGVSSTGFSSGIFTNTQRGASGSGGDININTGAFRIADGAVVTAQTLNPSDGGNITINANTFEAMGGGQILTGTFSSGRAGKIILNARDSILLSGSDPNFVNRFNSFAREVVANYKSASGMYANTDSDSTGIGGTIEISTTNFNLTDGSQVSAQSQGTGRAGNITILADGVFDANNGDMITAADRSTGGAINITASDIRLRGDSDIRTNVSSGVGGGGNITLTADSILAFDDSDILAFADRERGQGGNIDLNTPAFFGEDFQSTPIETTDPETLEGNNRVDINASGAVAGAITIPDVSFIQNSLTELPENVINTETLIANSCIARNRTLGGTFIITGADGLPIRPGNAILSPYPTGTVRTVPNHAQSSSSGASRPWKKGDPIVEPTGVYRQANGKLVLSRECSRS